MTEQPNQRPDGTGPSDSLPPYQPPAFVPPQGSEIPPPPLYNQGQFGPFGQDPYNQSPPPGNQNQYGQDRYGQNQYNQGVHPGQAGSPYGQGDAYGQAPYSQVPSYGQPSYYGMVPQPKGLSIASLVCGIVAVVFGFIMIPQIAAVITGHLGLKREPAGKGLAVTGLVLGYLCLVGYGLFWLLLLIGLTIARTTYGY